MKTLYLVRHSKAISSESGVNDFKRALTKRGVDDAKTMSKRLGKKRIAPNILISSPADRALETAHIFATEFDYPVRNILLKEEIYGGGAAEIRHLLTQLDDSDDVAMLFGHEPALSNLAALLLSETEGLEMRTTGVVGIGFETASWQALGEQTGILLLFDFPVHATPKVYKKVKKAISEEISISVASIMEGIDSGVSQHVQKVLKKTSKKLAKELTRVLQSSKVEALAGINELKRIDRLRQDDAIKHDEPAASQVTGEIERPKAKSPKVKTPKCAAKPSQQTATDSEESAD